MIFNVKAEENIFQLSKDKKKAQKRLIFVCAFIIIAVGLNLVDDFYHGRGLFLIVVYLFIPLVFFSHIRDLIRTILNGEILIFDRKKGEFLKNSIRQRRIDEIAKIELYHHSGDDVDTTYLHIIYTDDTFYLLDEDSISVNEELAEFGRLLADFLKVPLTERQHLNKSPFTALANKFNKN